MMFTTLLCLNFVIICFLQVWPFAAVMVITVVIIFVTGLNNFHKITHSLSLLRHCCLSIWTVLYWYNYFQCSFEKFCTSLSWHNYSEQLLIRHVCQEVEHPFFPDLLLLTNCASQPHIQFLTQLMDVWYCLLNYVLYLVSTVPMSAVSVLPLMLWSRLSV